ncbi:MAG: LIC12162 family transferase [Flavobacteriaceae bacterium]
MHLVTTSIIDTWPQDEKTEILFLGEWCRLYSRKNEWVKRNHSVLKYHWDNREKLKRDFKYLNELYEYIIPIISKKMNVIHNVNYSNRYWRVLIGPWLSNFIQIIFDRWFMLQSLDNVNSVSTIKQNRSDQVPNDMAEFNMLFIEDEWNEFIYSLIIQKEKLVPKIIKVRKNFNKAKEENDNKKLKNIINGILNIYNKIFTLRNKYFFLNSYFPRWALFLVNLKLKQLPSFSINNPVPRIDFDLSFRNWKILEDSEDKFLNILNYLIPLQIPKIYLEGFSRMKSVIKKSNWPKSPKVIFTANSYSEDDFFKVWAASKIEKSSKLIIAQHGGHFGMTPMESHAEHQYIISDKWISWGWHKKDIPKIKAIGNIKIIRKKKYISKPSGYGLIIGMEYPRFSYYLYSVPISSQYLSHLKNQFLFLDELPQKIFREILFKPYPTNYKWFTNKRFLDIFPNLNIDKSGKSLRRLLKDARICIVTYNGTTFLESFAWDFPTIIFFDSLFYELNNEAKASFEILKRVNIFHSTPESAALHLVKIWDDVMDWWNEPLTQFAVEEFSKTWNSLDSELIKNLVKEIR